MSAPTAQSAAMRFSSCYLDADATACWSPAPSIDGIVSNRIWSGYCRDAVNLEKSLVLFNKSGDVGWLGRSGHSCCTRPVMARRGSGRGRQFRTRSEVPGLGFGPMADSWLSETRMSYDTDAVGYADQVRGLLDNNAYLRASLALFADLVRQGGGGPVADVGCGPGYVTSHLHDLGVDAFGIDLAPEMIALARRDYPGLRFEVGTMTDLDLAEHSMAGLVAFWSVIHIPDHAVPGVFNEFKRVLRPGSPLLVGFHVGARTHHTTEGYTGRPVNVQTHRRSTAQITGWLRDAGFVIEAEQLLRPEDEVPGAIVFARSHPGPHRPALGE